MRIRFADLNLQRILSLRRGSPLLGVVLLAASFAPCLAITGRAVKKDAKRQIEDMEVQWRDAQLTGNVPEMDKLLSEDYFGISMTGQVNTKAQQLDRMRKRTLMLSRIDLSDLKVKLIGSTAIVTSRAVVEGVSDGLPMRGSFRYTRVYQRTAAGQWKITNFEATRIGRSNDPNEERPGGEGRP
jgi:ketosteroid isomerase-like protein